MAIRYVENLAEERNSLATQVMALADVAANENRELTESESNSVKGMRSRIDSLDNEIRSWSNTQESFAKFADITNKGVEKRDAAKADNRSLGQAFVESPEFRNYGFSGSSGRFETRAPITTGADPGKAFIQPDRSFSLPVPTYQTPLLNAIGNVQVSSGTVEYVTFGAAAPLAGVVPEGTPKPEAVLTASTVTQSLQTVAHWVQVTRQALEDGAQLQSWIDGNLTRGVGDKLEALAAAAITGATLPTATGADLLSAIRVGVGAVQTAGFQPNAVLLNPADYAAIDIQVMSTAGTAPVGVSSVWGLSVIPVGAVSEGSALVGDWQSAATFFYRAGTSVHISDSHGDTFLSNIFTVLAERRALTAVTRPEAAVKVTASTTQVAQSAARK